METCKTCSHWTKEVNFWTKNVHIGSICYPVDAKTCRPRPLKGLGIRYCGAAKVIDQDKGLPLDGFGVGDNLEGETLYTAENFGCVKHSLYQKLTKS